MRKIGDIFVPQIKIRGHFLLMCIFCNSGDSTNKHVCMYVSLTHISPVTCHWIALVSGIHLANDRSLKHLRYVGETYMGTYKCLIFICCCRDYGKNQSDHQEDTLQITPLLQGLCIYIQVPVEVLFWRFVNNILVKQTK